MWIQRTSPSADLYFAGSMERDLESGIAVQLSPTVFCIDDALVVVRHLSGLRSEPDTKRLIYVVDDDWRAGLSDHSLSLGYRANLALREARQGRRLERRANVILTSTTALADQIKSRWPNKHVETLEPAWPQATTGLSAERPIQLAYLSAATHRADFEFIKPVLETVISHKRLHLTVTANAPIPPAWKTASNVTVLPVLDWGGYKNWMGGKEFDIGLYPIRDTPFNAMRSRNKLLEFDQFGAALLCSKTWQPGARAAAENRCIALANDVSEWQAALPNLCDTPGSAKSLACANRRAIAIENPQEVQRLLWCRILGRDSRYGRS